MHEELWSGVELKVSHAEFFLDMMGKSLQGPERTQHNVALEASGAIIDNGWQRSFYAYLDAFLAMTRSVPEIINACFGHDDRGPAEMRRWFDALPAEERERRNRFTADFDDRRETFARLLLSTARNVSLHRSGVAPVEVRIVSQFGVTYVGSPTTRVPIADSRPAEVGGGLPWESPAPLRPKWWSDVLIDRRPLFEECKRYVAHAGAAVEAARGLAERVHGDAPLTPPP